MDVPGELVFADRGAVASQAGAPDPEVDDILDASASARAAVGDRIGHASLTWIDGGRVVERDAVELLGTGRSAVIGVVGAFTPLCSTHHVPEMIERAPILMRSGFDRLVCVVPNDPWVVKAWAGLLDPKGRIRFVADDGFGFARSLGVLKPVDPALHLGVRPQRFALVVRDGVLERVSVDADPTSLDCTRAASF